MKIRMLTSIAGEISAVAGDEIEIDAATAKRLIASGQAEPLKGSPEAAAKKRAPERATAKRARAR